MKLKYVWILITLFYSSEAFTSKEGILRLSKFQIESNGIGESGPVIVTGRQNSKGDYESLLVTAFGKKTAVPKSVLEKISGRSNGLQISYEVGRVDLGGKTVYLQFSFGFVSGQKERVVLAIKENGQVDVVSPL